MPNKFNSLSLPTHFDCVGLASAETRFKQVSPENSSAKVCGGFLCSINLEPWVLPYIEVTQILV